MSKSARAGGFHLLIALAMLGWGGSWVTAKWTASYPPLVTSWWRFVLTALSFVAILRVRREPFSLPRETWGWVVVSAISLALYNLFFLAGLVHGGGGYGGVLVPTLSPAIACLLSVVFLRERLRGAHGLGLALGLAGGALQIFGPHMELGAILRPENLHFVGAAATYAVLVHAGAIVQRRVSVFRYSLWLFALSALFVLPFGAADAPFDFGALGTDFWINVVYLTLVAGTFGTTVYFVAARRIGPSRASAFSFLVPVSALALAFVFLGEEPAWTSVAGGGLSVAAVFLIQRR